MAQDALLYGSPPHEISMDGRLLAHLKIVIVAKLRRNEPFLLSWDQPASEGSGRASIWLHPSIPLQFVFTANRPPQLNQNWLELLSQSAMSSEGLRLMPEPQEGVAES
ncbi:hypothetical protein PYV02_14255 [Leifsonia sp. H3M29-4]|uniref:DUF7882 family protein n=1 Tax=Salinibacterium metalliresistens TaxID=3031321 RepID=UPI0023DAD1D6|nr:hypothetical protein [Salinibacterium metalliresistens]MDF1480246.1 hypothetical protein [Salinibacterium metalliresistens]